MMEEHTKEGPRKTGSRGSVQGINEDPLVLDCIRSVEELYRRVKDDATTDLGQMCRSTLIKASRISGCPLQDPNLVAAVTSTMGESPPPPGDGHGYEEDEEEEGDDEVGEGGAAGAVRRSHKLNSPVGADEVAPLGGPTAPSPVGCLNFGWRRRRTATKRPAPIVQEQHLFTDSPAHGILDGKGMHGVFEGALWGTPGRDRKGHEATESAEYKAAPIVDITAVFGSDPIPPRFHKISHTPYGRRADLNSGAGGHYIYLCYRKDLSRQKPPIVSLVVIFPGRKEFLPPTFSVVRRKGQPVDFNAGTSSESVYICFKRGAGNPITNIQVLFPKKQESIPRGYTLLDRTPFKYEADLNAGGSSTTIVLCYKQLLRNVHEMNGDTGYGLVPEGHGSLLFPSNGGQAGGGPSLDHGEGGGGAGGEAVAGGGGHASTSQQHMLLDETQSVTSSRALNVLWGHADTHPPRDQLIPALRRSLLTPLISALYTASSDIVTVALDHLLHLASRHLLGPASRGDDSEEALQEVLVEALCYFNNRVQAERFDEVVQYLRSVVPGPTSRRDLSPSSLQQVFTTCVFLCNFEAYRTLHTEVLMARRDSVSGPPPPPDAIRGPVPASLLSTPLSYAALDTQGADCTAYASLRYLIQETLKRFEAQGEQPRSTRAPTVAATVAGRTDVQVDGGGGGGGVLPHASHRFIRDLVHGIVDGAVDHVELAKTTQRALDCIKRSNAFSYESFWKEILSVSELLADSPVAVNTFLVLAAICKLASEQPRLKKTGEMVERDVAGKIISLDLLCFFLRKGGDRFVQSRQFGCQIRRVLVSCLISNVLVGLDDIRVLRRVLTAIFTLWKGYRQWLKVELGVLWDEVLYRILRFRPFKAVLPAQMAVLSELVAWLEVEPNSLVELYLNYDLDRKSLTVRQHMLAFQQLVAVMCSLGEDLGASVASRHEDEPEIRAFYLRALQAVALLTRSLMNASGHANLIPQDAKVREISLDQQLGGGWEQDVLMPLVRRSWGPGEMDALLEGAVEEEEGEPEDEEEEGDSKVGGEEADEEEEEDDQEQGKDGDKAALRKRGKGDKVPLMDSSRSRQQSSSSDAGAASTPSSLGRPLSLSLSLSSAASLRKRKKKKVVAKPAPKAPPTMGRASSVRLRQEQHKRQEDHLEQALKLYKTKGLKKAIQYLVASNFMSDTPRDIAAFLRVYRHVLDPLSMGDFLGEGGNGSDTTYWNLIRMNYIRASSFHNMALEPALRYFLTRGGFRLPGEGQKADRILQVFGTCYFDDNKSLACCPFQTADAAYMTSYAIIMLQTDLHKANVGRRKRMTKDEFIVNTRHIAPELTREHLSEMYDSILEHPIEELLFLPSSSTVGRAGGPGGGGGSKTLTSSASTVGDDPSKAEAMTAVANRQEMATALRGADELLCGLAVYPDRFSIVGINANLTPDAVKLMFESVWFTLHILINSVLEKATQNDPEAVVTALDILMYAVSASMFLDLQTPGTAFANQLGKFKSHQEKISFGPSPWKATTAGMGGGGGSGLDGERGHEKEKWFLEVSRAVGEAKWGAIGHIHALISDLKESVQQSRIREELKAVAKRIEPRANLLDDASRHFIREGDLVKKCRYGKSVTYRFFLFSDQLLYAHRKLSGEYKVHAQLILNVMKVANVDSDRRGCSFQILHCQKSFVVTAESPEMKRIWMRDILEAKSLCLGLKDAAERQLSVISRLHVESERVMALIQIDDGTGGGVSGPSGTETLTCESSPLVPSFGAGGSIRRSSTSEASSLPPPPPPPSSSSSSEQQGAGTGGVTPPLPPAIEAKTVRLVVEGDERMVSELELELLFFNALLAYRGLLQDEEASARMDGAVRAVMDGLFLQFHLGDWKGRRDSSRTAALRISVAALQAWKGNSGMSQTSAMTAFIKKLSIVIPDWNHGV